MLQYCHHFYENMATTVESRDNRDQPVHLYISLVDIIMIIINAIITIDLHMWLVFIIIMSCFHHHHSLHGNHRQPVHVTCVLRPADLSVAVSVVVGKNLLMREIELAKVSSEVGLVFVNC